MPTTFYNTVDSPAIITAIGASAGVTPAAGDSVVLSQYATNFTTADLGSNALALLHTRAGWSGSIEDAAELKFVATTGVVKFEHSGRTLRFGGQSSSTVFQTVIWNPSGGGRGIFTTGIATTLSMQAGSLVCAGTITTGIVVQGSHEIRSNATAATLIQANGGRLLLQRDVTTLGVSGCDVTIDDPSCSPGTTNIHSGRITYKRCGSSGGTLNAYGGVLDFTYCSTDITFAGGTLYPGAKMIIPQSIAVNIGACTNLGIQIDYV